jgi:hypothetical protein
MEDDADGVALPGANAADPVAHVHAVAAARPVDGSVVHGERHRIALAEGHDFGPALHAGALFCQNELPR